MGSLTTATCCNLSFVGATRDQFTELLAAYVDVWDESFGDRQGRGFTTTDIAETGSTNMALESWIQVENPNFDRGRALRRRKSTVEGTRAEGATGGFSFSPRVVEGGHYGRVLR